VRIEADQPRLRSVSFTFEWDPEKAREKCPIPIMRLAKLGFSRSAQRIGSGWLLSPTQTATM